MRRLPGVVLVLLLWASPVRAAIQLTVDGCVAVRQEAVQRIFAVELEARGVADGIAAVVRASCSGALVALSVRDPGSGRTMARTMDLLSSPERARPRLLALALAELLYASWSEVDASRPPSLAAATVDRPRPASPHRPFSVRVAGLASCQGTFSGGGALFGGGLRIGGDHGYHLGWAVDLVAHHGGAGSALGALGANTVSAGPVLSFQQQVHLRSWPLGLRAGGGLRAGAAVLMGTPGDAAQVRGGTVYGPMVGPTGQFSATLGLPHRLLMEVVLEGGYVLTPVAGRVDGMRVLAIEGPWLLGQLGFGVFP